MKISEIITEMAVPTAEQRATVYYHGTSTYDSAKNIALNGFDPRYTDIKYADRPTAIARPIQNRIYMSADIAYALIYALGGDMAGGSIPPSDIEKYGQYGYVFEIPGKKLGDIIPDEDSVGQFVGWCLANRLYYREKYPKFFADGMSNGAITELISLAKKYLTATQLRRVTDGDYEYYIKAGKRLLPLMSDSLKLKLIDLGAHVANEGPIIKPTKCWQIDRLLVPKLAKDGSNFFKIAKRCKF